MKFLTTKQAAELIGVTPSRIRQLIMAGALTAFRGGRDLWLDPAELKRYKRPRRGRPAGK